MFPPYAFLVWIRPSRFLPIPATGRHKKVLLHPAEDPVSRLLPTHFLPGATSVRFTKDSLIRLHSLLPRPLNKKKLRSQHTIEEVLDHQADATPHFGYQR